MPFVHPVLCNSHSSSIASTLPFWSSVTFRGRLRRKSNFVVQLNFFTPSAFLNKSNSSSLPPVENSVSFSDQPAVVHNSLRLLQWDKLSHSVASFAGTSLGQQATESQLWSLNKSYEESLKLLEETNAAVEMHNNGCSMDFTAIHVQLVKSAMQHARRGLHVGGNEALALVVLLQSAETLQLNVKAAIKDDADWLQRFMPLSEMILGMFTSGSLVKFIQQLIDEDGAVKDSASSALKRSREQVRSLERKLYQLMEALIRTETIETSSLEVRSIDGRWCIKSETDLHRNIEGLLLSSGSGTESIMEPLSAVPLNDELQQAKESVLKAESEVLLRITEKIQVDLDDIENLFKDIIELDVINARATYSLSFGGTRPDLFYPNDKSVKDLSGDGIAEASHPTQMKWNLYLPKAFHPLLLQKHRQNLQKATKEVNDAKAEIRRRKQQAGNVYQKEADISLSSLQSHVEMVEQNAPVPVDVFVARTTRVVVITGPNTGGKTICLKTVGLAAIMAKSGLYVLSSEPVKIPWFDFVFADIGDEQSLSQSLSTFSGHLKQTSEILSHSTNRSLVLLDEVGAGTNPLEGAALGMSLLESFASSGSLLTIATTHHGELKTLKYSNDAFENACMEFDDVNLKPTYKILWGVPGRSNAINIAERLGLPNLILDDARGRYGPASVEINEAIVDMEKFKQNFHEHVHESQHYLMLARDLHGKLLVTRQKVIEHGINERQRQMQEISQAAAVARSTLHKKLRQYRATPAQSSRITTTDINQKTYSSSNGQGVKAKIGTSTSTAVSFDNGNQEPLGKRQEFPKVGDMVHVPSLKKKARVLKVESSKGELVVQSGIMKLKLKLDNIEI
ncbi:DNA mismatch repair protein MutS, core [Heracleum sosnowskyi]|uniref:DNA mismatch repair protein MutS, core n=1 Tax=Heracleum sosnowskyi TaxID=360622 RepID=A0AAD8N7A9_9APIA|nr:DNA mismatch repair protein MutS, core [Heracleum sosnowskyi]